MTRHLANLPAQPYLGSHTSRVARRAMAAGEREPTPDPVSSLIESVGGVGERREKKLLRFALFTIYGLGCSGSGTRPAAAPPSILFLFCTFFFLLGEKAFADWGL